MARETLSPQRAVPLVTDDLATDADLALPALLLREEEAALLALLAAEETVIPTLARQLFTEVTEQPLAFRLSDRAQVVSALPVLPEQDCMMVLRHVVKALTVAWHWAVRHGESDAALQLSPVVALGARHCKREVPVSPLQTPYFLWMHC